MNAPAQVKPAFDVARVREDFPILRELVHGKPLVYLDNAATTQKPAVVIETLDRYYRTTNANIHRGVHTLSARATDAFEAARETTRRFLNAPSTAEIVFTRGTTEAINLVAQSWARSTLKAGDEILIGEAEHHSNIVPWQIVCGQTGAKLVVAPVDEKGELHLEAVAAKLTERTKLVAVGHVSNALGSVNPVAAITKLAHDAGALVLIDGAQAVAHAPVDVVALGCDFYAFSGHKVFGPTGIGALYGRRELLEAMPPWQGGGDMIRTVSFEGAEYNDLPYKFEAGTPHIAGAIGLGAALEYVMTIDFAGALAHEHEVLHYATGKMIAIEGLRVIGAAREKSGVLSFVIEGLHPHDVGMLLDHQGVAIRTGHHCAMPVLSRFGLSGTARASFSIYNTREDVDCLVAAVRKAQQLLS
ncbi:MAG: cysteine desulfurase [Gammaproteobacteria bacterium]|nr:cysteine desulfurase [Gammaproteobacteria bacterium]